MKGEIHGIISREEAWRMWAPYGERGVVSGELNPDFLSPEEAIMITTGADDDTAWEIYSYFHEDGSAKRWHEELRDYVESGPEQGFMETIVDTNNRQLAAVRAARNEAFEGAVDYVKTLGSSVLQLAHEGFWTAQQADKIIGHLVAPDGLPYIQYTPLTKLESCRLALMYNNREPDISIMDTTDLQLGMIKSSRSMHSRTLSVTRHNRAHEWVHALSGAELYDITRDDGQRLPDAIVIGHFAAEPSTEIGDGNVYSEIANTEINEGWADYIALSLMDISPALGTPRDYESLYAKWAEITAGIRRNAPSVFRAITDAALAETNAHNPTAKREALARMHDIADHHYGAPKALTTRLQEVGSLTDIYPRGKEKTAG